MSWSVSSADGSGGGGAPHQALRSPLVGLARGEQGAEHRSAQRRVAGRRRGLDDQLDLRAARATLPHARPPRRSTSVTATAGVSQRRPDHHELGARSTPGHGAPPLASREGHDPGAPQVLPEAELVAEELGPEPAGQRVDQRWCRSRAGGPRCWFLRPRSFRPGCPAVSIRTSLASGIESSGAGGRSRGAGSPG